MFHKFLFKDIHAVVNNVRSFSSSRPSKNLYDVLKLPRNCSTKDIKQAFIKLSKEYHPDKTDNKRNHKKFLEVQNAYSVLSKPESRASYDLGLSNPDLQRSPRQMNNYNPWTDPIFYQNRDKSQDAYFKQKPYYGVKGLKKVSNKAIAIGCLVFMFLGLSLQVMAIRNSLTFQREELLRKSAENSEILNQTKNKAEINGNDKQLETLKKNLLDRQKNKKDES